MSGWHVDKSGGQVTVVGLDKAELVDALTTLVDDYAAWIGDQRARVGKEIKGYDVPANEALDRCKTTLERLHAGLKVLLADPKALEASTAVEGAFTADGGAVVLTTQKGDFLLELTSGGLKKLEGRSLAGASDISRPSLAPLGGGAHSRRVKRCQGRGVRRCRGRDGGGPATGAGAVGGAAGLRRGLAGGMRKRAQAGEA